MAYFPTFRKGKREQAASSLDRWWLSTPENVARDLYSYAVALERGQRPERFRRYGYHILATGHAPISYGFACPGMGPDSGAYATDDQLNAQLIPPAENVPALALDVMASKIWCERQLIHNTTHRRCVSVVEPAAGGPQPSSPLPSDPRTCTPLQCSASHQLLRIASWTPADRQAGIFREAVAMLEARAAMPSMPFTERSVCRRSSRTTR